MVGRRDACSRKSYLPGANSASRPQCLPELIQPGGRAELPSRPPARTCIQRSGGIRAHGWRYPSQKAGWSYTGTMTLDGTRGFAQDPVIW